MGAQPPAPKEVCKHLSEGDGGWRRGLGVFVGPGKQPLGLLPASAWNRDVSEVDSLLAGFRADPAAHAGGL